MINRQDLQIRDPFIYVQDHQYYLYGTTDADCWKGPGLGFNAYTSTDLVHFSDPIQIFNPSPDFWGKKNFWAPEMHAYRGKYYLFASFKAEGMARATSVLKSDSPLGPFLPFGEKSLTPSHWECLDGTLYLDAQGKPWLVFCHEWVQPGGGSICALQLKEDLSDPQGEPIVLFEAKDRPWAKKMMHSSGIEGYVTDGPFLYTSPSGMLYLFWSSFSQAGYALAIAKSPSASITGPWLHEEVPLVEGGCGHGMVFVDVEGHLRLALHHPNDSPNERPLFIKLMETDAGIGIDAQEQPLPFSAPESK